MRTRVSRPLALAGAAVLVLSAIAVPAALAATPSVSSCNYTASTGQLTATFSVDPAGSYAWAWRSGQKALGGGAASLEVAQYTKTATTKRNLSGEIKFGVVSSANPMDYAYFTCTRS